MTDKTKLVLYTLHSFIVLILAQFMIVFVNVLIVVNSEFFHVFDIGLTQYNLYTERILYLSFQNWGYIVIDGWVNVVGYTVIYNPQSYIVHSSSLPGCIIM